MVRQLEISIRRQQRRNSIASVYMEVILIVYTDIFWDKTIVGNKGLYTALASSQALIKAEED